MRWSILLFAGVMAACGADEGVAPVDSGTDAATDAPQGGDAGPDASEDAARDVIADVPLTDAPLDDVDPDAPPPVDVGADLPSYPEPAMDGLIIDVDSVFWDNMDDFLLDVVAFSNVQVYLSLLSANFFGEQKYRALGQEILRNPESFFANAALPLLRRYDRAGVLWAVDCMNEPEAMTAGLDGNYEAWGVSWREMQTFLAYCAATIHAEFPDLWVSAGSGWHDWDNVQAGYYDDLGFDFLDYHVYADNVNPPDSDALSPDLPVIIGECGQATDVWDDAIQLAAVTACFEGAERGGYVAALSWYYDYPGSTNIYAHMNADGTWRPVRAAFDDFVNRDQLQVGLNLAWLGGAYAHDLGPSSVHPTWSVGYDPDDARSVVADFEEVGIPIMRLWSFEAMEALHHHVVFADFERSVDGWGPSTADGTAYSTVLHPSDGTRSLELELDAGSQGWQGVRRDWTADKPLNLAYASQWRTMAFNALGVATGVNLAFVTELDGVSKTYQTRAGASQLWLNHDTGGELVVPLAAGDFPSAWALATAPDVGVQRPSDAELETVRSMIVRVYLSSGLSEVGSLHVDGVRVR